MNLGRSDLPVLDEVQRDGSLTDAELARTLKTQSRQTLAGFEAHITHHDEVTLPSGWGNLGWPEEEEFGWPPGC